jgi:hypothetical protein
MAHVAHRGNVGVKSASTTTVIDVTGTVIVGNVLIVSVAKDNAGTDTDGETNQVTSVADDQGNTYTKMKEWTRSDGSTGDGVTIALFYSEITTQLTTADQVTISHNNSYGRSAGLEEYSITGSGISLAGGNGNAGSGTSGNVTLSGLDSAEYNWISLIGFENKGNVTWTNDSDYTLRTIHSTGTAGAGAGNVTGNPGDRLGYTGTSDTYDFADLASSDWALLLVALEETGGTTPVNKDLAAQWDIAELVNKDLAGQFDILNLVNKDLQGKWDIFDSVNKDLQADWDIRELVNKDLQGVWDMEGAVSKDLDARWDITELVYKDFQSLWDMFILVSKDLQADWDIRQLATKDLQAIWDMEGAVSKDLEVQYDIAELVNKDLEGIWDIFILVNKDLEGQWDILNLVNKDLEGIWDILGGGPVNKDLEAVWDILALISAKRRKGNFPFYYF